MDKSVTSPGSRRASSIAGPAGVTSRTVTDQEPLPPTPETAAWSAWERVAFRYLLCHFALYALPMPFSQLTSMLAQLVHKGLAYWCPDAEARGDVLWGSAAWTERALDWVNTQFGRVDGLWEGLTTWLAAHHLLPFDVIHQATGSGDTAHDWARLGVIVLASLLLAGLWSLLPSPGAYRRLGRWLHLGARFWLGYWMLVYGLIKLYRGQFGEPSLWMLTQEIGDKSPMGMVWTFMGANKPYEVFSGLGEVVGGLLMFHRATALLGCFVTAAVMANVAALNWLYDVPVKLFSSHLLLAAVCLMAPWRQRLFALFVQNAPSAPVDLRVVRSAWLGVPLLLLGIGWVSGTLLVMHLQNRAPIADERMARFSQKPQWFGMWKVDAMTLDGVEVAAGDVGHWNFLAFDRGMWAFVRTPGGQGPAFDITAEDAAAGTVTLKPRGANAGEPVTWTLVEGKKTVQVTDPEPKTMADFNKMVDVERRTIVVKGQWQGKALEVHAYEKPMRIHRGFHFVQEMPYNR